MKQIRAVIFDADGVLVKPEMPFSEHYAQQNGLNAADFTQFFRGEFEEALCGRADLKDLIQKHNDIWCYSGNVQDLLDMWFTFEHKIDPIAMSVVTRLKDNAVPIYLATNQEKYRAAYMGEKMFAGIFNEVFTSSDIGYTKKDVRFWELVVRTMAENVPGIKPGEIVFFDDSQDSVDGAASAGLNAHLYTSVSQLEKSLSSLL